MASQIKTEQEMFPLVEGWLKSGLTQKQFCSKHGLPIHILAYWVGRYRKSQLNKTAPVKSKVITSKTAKEVVATDSSSGFIRLSPPPSPAPTPASIEVVLPTGAIIRFSTIVPADYLTQLLKVCSH